MQPPSLDQKKSSIIIQSLVTLTYLSAYLPTALKINNDINNTIKNSHYADSSLIYPSTILHILIAAQLGQIGWRLYAKHATALLSGKDIKELDHHLTDYYTAKKKNKNLGSETEINANNFSVYRLEIRKKKIITDSINSKKIKLSTLSKTMTLMSFTILTFPLGWTKAAYLPEWAQLPWLLWYSLIDLLPHINHLTYIKHAKDIFQESSCALQCAIIIFICSHASEDILDYFNIGNVSKELLELLPFNTPAPPLYINKVWLSTGVCIELVLPIVEAVLHTTEPSPDMENLSTKESCCKTILELKNNRLSCFSSPTPHITAGTEEVTTEQDENRSAKSISQKMIMPLTIIGISYGAICNLYVTFNENSDFSTIAHIGIIGLQLFNGYFMAKEIHHHLPHAHHHHCNHHHQRSSDNAGYSPLAAA